MSKPRCFLNPLLAHVVRGALDAVRPDHLIREHLSIEDQHLLVRGQSYDLSQFRAIHVLGAGKGACALFHGLEHLSHTFTDRIRGGVIVSLPEHAFSHPKVAFHHGSHPLPDPTGLAAAEAMVNYIHGEIKPQDLVLFLLTGGASSLLTMPIHPLGLEDKIRTTQLLLNCGADIREINCVRKHLSALKGGRLAEMIQPARMISLVVSDIIGSPLEDIGSGPSVGDSTGFPDAMAILRKYNLEKKVPPGVTAYIQKGIDGEVPETPLPGSEKFENNAHVLLADNRTALDAAVESASQKNIPSRILTAGDHGEARDVAVHYAGVIRECIESKSMPRDAPHSNQMFKPPVLLICGGELTVTLRGSGRGGRNQEFILALLRGLRDVKRAFHILSMGTDGIDGPTDAAGAWGNHLSLERAAQLKLDPGTYLDNNDSYSFFDQLHQLIKTGPTGTNVMDLRLFYLP